MNYLKNEDKNRASRLFSKYIDNICKDINEVKELWKKENMFIHY